MSEQPKQQAGTHPGSGGARGGAPTTDDSETLLTNRPGRSSPSVPVPNIQSLETRLGSLPRPQSTHSTADVPAGTGGFQGNNSRPQYRAGSSTGRPGSTGSGGYSTGGFDKAQELAQAAQGKLLKERFVLEEMLGRGGMGVVYRTRDLRKVEANDANPYIATKVLSSGFKDHADAFVTLQQEAAKSQQLAHPNIVKVYDFDRDGSVIFMTMELLDGESLDKVIKRHQPSGVPKAQAMLLLNDLCAALAYAHQEGLVHSDLKPANIFVMSKGNAKVLDFGIARVVSEEARQGRFDAGSLGALTPAYATIEMVDGQAPSFADDVYALACVAYELFAGHHPFARTSAKEAKNSNLKPARPKSLSRRQWAALSAALALDKADRTPTIEEFQRAFFPRKIPTALWIVAALSLFGLAGAGAYAYQQQQQVARTIAARIQQAEACFARSDYACSIEQSQVAINLDADNARARQLLEQATRANQEQSLGSVLREAEECLAARDYECTRVKVAEILKRDSNNRAAKKLRAKAASLSEGQSIRELLEQGEACFAKNDLDCARLFSEQAQAVNAKNPAARAFAQKIQDARTAVVQQAAARDAEAQQLVSAGTRCLIQGDYACATKRANAALQVVPGYTPALELKQNAATGAEVMANNNARADALLRDAAACLQARNYKCAIATSDAALAIVPRNLEAMQIKQQALEQQERVKKSIEIK